MCAQAATIRKLYCLFRSWEQINGRNLLLRMISIRSLKIRITIIMFLIMIFQRNQNHSRHKYFIMIMN